MAMAAAGGASSRSGAGVPDPEAPGETGSLYPQLPESDVKGLAAAIDAVAPKKDPRTVLDGLGSAQERHVTIDELKNRFFVLGMQSGFALQMFVMSIIVMASAYDQATGAVFELSQVYYPLYRGLFLLCFFLTCYGVDLYMWKRFEINYRQILGVTHEHNYHCIVRGSFGAMTVVFFSFVLYILTLNTHISGNKHVWPISALAILLLALFWPLNWMHEWEDRKQRYDLMKTIVAILFSPLTRVTFARTFIADVLTSMPKLFGDFATTTCVLATREAFHVEWDPSTKSLNTGNMVCNDSNPSYVAVRATLLVLPFWLRLMQCCRQYRDTRLRKHAFNALKYCTSIAVVALSLVSSSAHNSWAYAWTCVSVLSSLYTFWWDIHMDWGLRVCRAARTRTFVYPRWFYVVAVFLNGCARLTWAVYISPGQTVVRQHVVLVLGCVELLRRAQWALLRLEWEQHSRNIEAVAGLARLFHSSTCARAAAGSGDRAAKIRNLLGRRVQDSSQEETADLAQEYLLLDS